MPVPTVAHLAVAERAARSSQAIFEPAAHREPIELLQRQARTEKALAKARTKDSMSAFSKLTHVVDGEARIVAEPPLIVPIDDAYTEQNDRDYKTLA